MTNQQTLAFLALSGLVASTTGCSEGRASATHQGERIVRTGGSTTVVTSSTRETMQYMVISEEEGMVLHLPSLKRHHVVSSQSDEEGSLELTALGVELEHKLQIARQKLVAQQSTFPVRLPNTTVVDGQCFVATERWNGALNHDARRDECDKIYARAGADLAARQARIDAVPVSGPRIVLPHRPDLDGRGENDHPGDRRRDDQQPIGGW